MSNTGHETADKRPGSGSPAAFLIGLVLVVLCLAFALFYGWADERASEVNSSIETPAAATAEPAAGN